VQLLFAGHSLFFRALKGSQSFVKFTDSKHLSICLSQIKKEEMELESVQIREASIASSDSEDDQRPVVLKRQRKTFTVIVFHSKKQC